jgi:hypothetical protein
MARIQDNWNPFLSPVKSGPWPAKRHFPQAGGCGNKLHLPFYTDIGVVPMYDRTFKIVEGDGIASTKEQHERIDITLTKKLTSTFDQSTQIIAQNPITVYITPYDSPEVCMRTTSCCLRTQRRSHTETCRGVKTLQKYGPTRKELRNY